MTPSAFIQEYFRIRSGDTVGLNVDSGWAAIQNANANIGTGLEFRIRFKVRETAGGSDTSGFKLQVNHNSLGFVDVDVNLGITTPATQAVVSSQFTDGDAATELLTNTITYVNGEGLTDNTSAVYSLTSEETELEWCLLIMGFFDGPSQVDDADTLEFRVVQADGTAFTGTYVNPTITVDETAKFIGGTYVETPQNIGPIDDSNGNLYFMMEPAESDNVFMMIKSTDGGNVWREMDGANRPVTNDLEGVATFSVGTTIHILHHSGGEVVYHSFRMSDDGSPDTWNVTDESVIAAITSGAQTCAITVRSDSTIVGLYRRSFGAEDNIFYKIRSAGGVWGSEVNLDTTASTDFFAVSATLGASDKTHIFYTDATNFDLYHKSLDSGDSLSARESAYTDVKDTGRLRDMPIVETIYWDSNGDEKIMVGVQDESDDQLYSVVVTNDGVPEAAKQITDAAPSYDGGGSGQPNASLIVDDDRNVQHLLFGLDSDGDLFKDKAINDGGWGTDTEVIDAVTIGFVRGEVFTHSAANGGATVIGFCYENSLVGGTGRIFYDEILIPGNQAFPNPKKHPSRNLLLRL